MKPHDLNSITAKVFRALEESGFDLDGDQAVALELFLSDLVAWSGKFHVFAKGSYEDSLVQQVLDCALMYRFAMDNIAGTRTGLKVLDIGTGFGIPGLIWKALDGTLDLTLIDRKLKVSCVLSDFVEKRDIKGVNVVLGDAATEEYPGGFDICVTKAAGRLSEVLPIASRKTAENGIYVTIKGNDWERELGEAPQNLMQLIATQEVAPSRGCLLCFT